MSLSRNPSSTPNPTTAASGSTPSSLPHRLEVSDD
jgi:hypothetical protein